MHPAWRATAPNVRHTLYSMVELDPRRLGISTEEPVQKYNENHSSANGQFTSGGGSGHRTGQDVTAQGVDMDTQFWSEGMKAHHKEVKGWDDKKLSDELTNVNHEIGWASKDKDFPKVGKLKGKQKVMQVEQELRRREARKHPKPLY